MSGTNLDIAKRYLKALGVFLDFRNGRICHQRNYDCFDPW